MHIILFLSNVLGTDLDEVLLCPGDGPDYYTPDEDFIAGNSMTIQFASDDSVTAPGAAIRLQLGMFGGSQSYLIGLKSLFLAKY